MRGPADISAARQLLRAPGASCQPVRRYPAAVSETGVSDTGQAGGHLQGEGRKAAVVGALYPSFGVLRRPEGTAVAMSVKRRD